MLNIEALAASLPSDRNDPPRFGASWVEVVAMEYARAHVSEAGNAAALAQLYLDALSEIRAWLSDGRPRIQSK